MLAEVTLFFQLGSGLVDAVAVPSVALPVVRPLKVMVKVEVAFALSDAIFHVAMLRHHTAVPVFDTFVSDDGSASAAHTFFAVAGPALRTVSVQVVFTPIFADVGHDNVVDTSALLDAGGAAATVTVYGPAVAFPAVFVAFTAYVKVFVPVGGFPPTTPFASIVNHAGAPTNVYVIAAGYPVVTNG